MPARRVWRRFACLAVILALAVTLTLAQSVYPTGTTI
jgi:hypothetical protein